MIVAAWERFRKWWTETGKPAVAEVASAWWEDLEENPMLHFISMVFGMVILLALKLAVWLVA